MSRRDQTNADLLRNVAKTFAKVAYFQVTNAFHLIFYLARSTVYVSRDTLSLSFDSRRDLHRQCPGHGRGKTWREKCVDTTVYGPARCQTLSFSRHREGSSLFFREREIRPFEIRILATTGRNSNNSRGNLGSPFSNNDPRYRRKRN